jgi:hypothetical protein
MRIVRRLYFYLVTLIGLELVIWGTVSLAQTLLDAPLGGAPNILASGLSLILVGIPIFLLHGAVIQRDAAHDPEERANRLRAIFFYAVRLATLIPIAQSAVSVIVHVLSSILGISSGPTFIGFEQTLADHLVVIVVNAVAWFYFDRLLRREHAALPDGGPLSEVRRLYSYTWLVYTLVLALIGVNFMLWYVLYIPSPVELASRGDPNLVNGLALALVGAPLWAIAWRTIQAFLSRPREVSSLLRQVVLYGLTVLPAILVVTEAINFISGALSWVLGETQTLANFSASYRAPLAMAVTLRLVWSFFYRPLAGLWASAGPDLQRRASLLRLYRTLISLLGNATTFIGAWMLFSVLVDSLLGLELPGTPLRSQLSGGIAALLVGISLWLRPWLALQSEARRPDDEGDHALRSVLRRAAFYLVIFLAVIGVMYNGGALLYRLFNAALGSAAPDLGSQVAHSLVQLALSAVWLAYHLNALRQDGRQAQIALAQKHAAFPVLVLDMQSGGEPFFSELNTALQAQAPGLPVTVFRPAEGLPMPKSTSFRAVILPGALASAPSVVLSEWLSNFNGKLLVAPLAQDGWVWLGAPSRPARDLAHETALVVRQLAEGEPLRPSPPNNPWVIAGYVFGGLFAAQLLLVAFAIVMSVVSR